MKSALLSAFVIPGAGQMYNREWGKGFFIAILFLLASLSLLIPLTYLAFNYFMNMLEVAENGTTEAASFLAMLSEYQLSLFSLFAASVFLYVYSIIDAYKNGGKKFNEQNLSQTD